MAENIKEQTKPFFPEDILLRESALAQKSNLGIQSVDPEVLHQELLRQSSYLNDPTQLATISKAVEFATQRHAHQKRQSGEPYIVHPISVAIILCDLRVDLASLVSAVLHDVVEDTDTSLESIEQEFGKQIAELVDGLTKIGKIKFRSSQERMAENFRKMLLAMAKDLRVILVKLADRLHNLRTIEALPDAKRQRIAQETLDIYAPLAHRLGIYGLKSELEDLCLKVTKNEIYKEISKNIAAKKKERETLTAEIKSLLEEEFRKYGFKHVVIYGRPKHFFSIYRKMIDRRIAFQDIHDLFAFRILVDSVKDCYEALGIVHSIWKPMPGRFKDYIAMPKANLYQSLHTTVVRPNGAPAEFQIRTFDMHRICEFGVAAHWAYKEKSAQESNLKKFSWLRQMMELQSDIKDPEEFLAALKVDLFEEEIFVFTPKGDVIQLAHGATPIDFAFAVHTNVGLRTTGAKVNGKIGPLRTKLKSGDIVEILTSSQQNPSKDWLNFATTTRAKNKIRSFLRSEQRESSKKLGYDLLACELTKIGFDIEKMQSTGKYELLFKASKESSFEELLIAIGYGRISATEIVNKAFPQSKSLSEASKELPATSPTQAPLRSKSQSGILVSGMTNILVSLGRCCNPLPGEDIMGFITRGRGVSIHRVQCPRAFDLDPARRVQVSWGDLEPEKDAHLAYIRVLTQDRAGVLAEVTTAISSSGANIYRAQVKVKDDTTGILDFEIRLKNLKQLNQVMKRIESVPNVILVERSKAGFSGK